MGAHGHGGPLPSLTIPYYSSVANSMLNVSVTLGGLNFSVPVLPKLVLQGKKRIKWHKYCLVIYSAMERDGAHGQSMELPLQIHLLTPVPPTPVEERHKAPFGELLNSTKPILLEGSNRQLATTKTYLLPSLRSTFYITQSK